MKCCIFKKKKFGDDLYDGCESHRNAMLNAKSNEVKMKNKCLMEIIFFVLTEKLNHSCVFKVCQYTMKSSYYCYYSMIDGAFSFLQSINPI